MATTSFIEIIENKNDEFNTIISNFKPIETDSLTKTLDKVHKEIPSIIEKTQTKLLSQTAFIRNDYPDYFGSSFRFVCEDTIKSISQNNINQFALNYKYITSMLIPYTLYIRECIKEGK